MEFGSSLMHSVFALHGPSLPHPLSSPSAPLEPNKDMDNLTPLVRNVDIVTSLLQQAQQHHKDPSDNVRSHFHNHSLPPFSSFPVN